MNEYIIKSDDLQKINYHLSQENLEFQTIQDFLNFLHSKGLLKINFHIETKQK